MCSPLHVYVSQGKGDSARVVIHQADSFFRERQFAPFIYYLGTEQIELAMLESRTADALKMVEGGGWRTDDALYYQLANIGNSFELSKLLTGKVELA